MCKKTSHRNYGGTQYPKFILYTQKRFQPERKAGVIKKFIRIFRISDLNAKKILAALDNDEFLDFKDCEIYRHVMFLISEILLSVITRVNFNIENKKSVMVK